MKHVDLASHAYGLTTDIQRQVNQLLQDYSPKLSLRRINDSDPAYKAGIRFNPPRIYGVWEEPVDRGETNWAFTFPEISITPALVIRVAENDFARTNPGQKFDQMLARNQLAQALKIKTANDKIEEHRDEMIEAGRYMAKHHGAVMMKINGEEMIVGDTIRPVRKFIS